MWGGSVPGAAICGVVRTDLGPGGGVVLDEERGGAGSPKVVTLLPAHVMLLSSARVPLCCE